MSGNDGYCGTRLLACAALAATAFAATGCVSGLDSPTYGTGVSSNQQLVTDVSGMFSLAPKKKPDIAYKPRPDLVKPNAAERNEALPAPQQAVASAGNPDWPESPEERRARIRADATANQDNPFYEPEVASDGTKPAVYDKGYSYRAKEANMSSPADVSVQRERFNKRLAESNQGDPTVRRYLSEPPLAYRQPADSAPVNDVGEDEWKKEKRLKREAAEKSGKKSGWFDWLPSL